MHHFACHQWSKISNKIDILGSSGKKTTKEQAKITVSAGTKTFANLKLKNTDQILLKLALYVCHLNTFHLL